MALSLDVAEVGGNIPKHGAWTPILNILDEQGEEFADEPLYINPDGVARTFRC